MIALYTAAALAILLLLLLSLLRGLRALGERMRGDTEPQGATILLA